MPGSYILNSVVVKKLFIVLLAIVVFLAVAGIGSMATLQIAKRQFEAEAQNIAAVLHSGISVADGVVTSLVASDYTNVNHTQINAHFSDVLGSYEYVSALGRFEELSHGEMSDHEALLADTDSGVNGLWYLDHNGEISLGNDSATRKTYLPLTVYKSRFFSNKASFTDLTGYDLNFFSDTRNMASAKSFRQTSITSLPEYWNRPGELLLLRTGNSDVDTTRGYMLELDLDEMASSGGVEIENYRIQLSIFSEQGEFVSESISEALYLRPATDGTELKFGKWFDNNKWLNSFSLGGKSLLLEISTPAGIPSGVLLLLCLAGIFLALIFLTIMQLVIKKRHATKMQRIESEKLYHARYRAAVTLASIDDAVITTDVQGKILYANESAEVLLGCSESSMQGREVDSVVVHTEEDGNLILHAADNSRRYINKKESKLKGLNGEDSGHVLVLRDVSVEYTLTQELIYKANHDALTGLANRQNFEDKLQKLVTTLETVDNALIDPGHVLCFIDLDRFKEVNDTCGHDAGDDLLMRVADTFTTIVREDDLVARLGGDEFGIVLRNCSRAAASQVTGRIQSYFQSFFFEYGGHIFPVRCSVGFVYFVPGEVSFDDVIKSADAACFDAKHRGRNSVCERSVGDSRKKADQNSMWLPRLKAALETDSFELLAQPVVSLLDGSIDTHEVLLRLNENGELISPVAFMKSAVRYELAESIDRWVVQTTLSRLATLLPQYTEDKFSINLSSQTIKSDNFLLFLKEQIQLFDVDPARLCFDLQESDLLSKPTVSEAFCRELRSIGAEVALDDFGAGLTSFELLKSISVTTLKIDSSLIANLDQSELNGKALNADQALVQSIHSFASSMGLTTIAEQVESTDCLQALKVLSVDFAQGSAVAEEVPFDTLTSDASGGASLKIA